MFAVNSLLSIVPACMARISFGIAEGNNFFLHQMRSVSITDFRGIACDVSVATQQCGAFWLQSCSLVRTRQDL